MEHFSSLEGLRFSRTCWTLLESTQPFLPWWNSWQSFLFHVVVYPFPSQVRRPLFPTLLWKFQLLDLGNNVLICISRQSHETLWQAVLWSLGWRKQFSGEQQREHCDHMNRLCVHPVILLLVQPLLRWHAHMVVQSILLLWEKVNLRCFIWVSSSHRSC